MKKHILSACGLLLCLFLNVSFTSADDEKQNYILMKDGQKIILKGEVSIDASEVNYEDAKGKTRHVKQKNIEKMSIGDRLFLNLPITSNMTRLQEVVAHNDVYLLTTYWQDGANYLYVYDKDMKPVVKKYKTDGRAKFNKKAYDDIALVYFSKCKDLLEAMQSNLNEGNKLIYRIYNHQCGKRTFE